MSYELPKAIQRGGVEEYLGLEPQELDLFEIMFDTQNALHMISTHHPVDEGHEPVLALRYRPFSGIKTFTWLGNNSPDDQKDLDEPILPGLFSVDTINRRLLFEPRMTMPLRDSYRALGGISAGYNGTLLDIIKDLQKSKIPIQQVTKLQNIQRGGINPLDALGLSQMTSYGIQQFERLCGMEGWLAYQVEGALSIEDILAEKFHPIRPFDDGGNAIFRWERDWGIIAR